MKKYLFIFAAGITLLACSPAVTEVVTDANEAEMPPAAVAEGKALYQNKCSKCHDLKVIKNHTTEQWGMILPKMAIKAKLIDNQEELINSYVQWELAK